MDLIDFGRYAGALLVTLGLLGGLALAVRHFGGRGALAGLFTPMGRPAKADPGALKIVDSVGLDAKRRLVAVRWGDAETLILLGPSGEKVVDRRPAAGAPSAEAGS